MSEVYRIIRVLEYTGTKERLAKRFDKRTIRGEPFRYPEKYTVRELSVSELLPATAPDELPWLREPNEDKWNGHYVCVMQRGGSDAWCGYVGVPPGHPRFDGDDSGLEVHGGITWNRQCLPDGTHAELQWFGFDCGHSGDWCPKRTRHPGDIYRTYAFARAETEKLDKQLWQIAKKARHYKMYGGL